MDLKEIGDNTRNWIYPAQDKGYWWDSMNSALNLQVPKAL
jgi:hypothetical protein